MNGDEISNWAKPSVPENRKRAVSKKTIERLSASKFCPKCALQGFCFPFHLFQINEDEALLMCKNPDCTFMPSSNWESLIVKRSISDLSVKSSKKSSSSSVSSRLSTKSTKNTQTFLKRISRPVTCSTYSTPVSASSSLLSLPQPSIPGVSASSGCLPPQKYLQDSSGDWKERKTLVPLGPFLSGHAHSFSSFETNRLEQKLQQRVVSQNQRAPSPSAQSNPNNRRIVSVTNKRPVTHLGPTAGIKKRACSLDSDSWSSSGSSLDSRPTTPLLEASDGKKVRQIVVPPATLSKLLEGSMTIEIRKSDKAGADVVFRAVKQQEATNIYSTQPNTEHPGVKDNTPVLDQLRSESASLKVVDSCGLEITEIGPLNDITSVSSSFDLPSISTSSDSVKSHIEAINFKLQSNLIKSHVDAINAHIEAIKNAVGCSDPGLLLDFSDLGQKFGVEIGHNSTTSQLSQGESVGKHC